MPIIISPLEHDNITGAKNEPPIIHLFGYGFFEIEIGIGIEIGIEIDFLKTIGRGAFHILRSIL